MLPTRLFKKTKVDFVHFYSNFMSSSSVPVPEGTSVPVPESVPVPGLF